MGSGPAWLLLALAAATHGGKQPRLTAGRGLVGGLAAKSLGYVYLGEWQGLRRV